MRSSLVLVLISTFSLNTLAAPVGGNGFQVAQAPAPGGTTPTAPDAPPTTEEDYPEEDYEDEEMPQGVQTSQ